MNNLVKYVGAAVTGVVSVFVPDHVSDPNLQNFIYTGVGALIAWLVGSAAGSAAKK